MKISKNIFLFFLIGSTFLWGCRDIYELEKYQRPEWLAGKLYSQIITQPDLSTFATCLQLTGYDSILDITGYYTVFAPNNQAFTEFFTLHPEYGGSLEFIPANDLENLVERHILQNGWSLAQLQSLDIEGWIDKNDPDNDKPRGYKRLTLQQHPDKKYFVESSFGEYLIVDSLESNEYKKVFSKSRKYGSVFFADYFGINDLQLNDYEFYFDRSFEPGNVYYGKAKIVSPEIFAENGFVYEVDQVTDPLFNAEEILQQEYSQFSYNAFRETMNKFSEFRVNMEATNLQPEAIAGGLFDTLYNLTFPGLIFNQNEEQTGPNTSDSKFAVRYQNGIFAPTDEAFQNLLNEVVTSASGYPHWTNYESIPNEIKRIIINAHLTDNPVYRTNIENGFKNGIDDFITIDEEDIVQRYYGSNCSFIGLNKAIVPRAFSAITGPVYLRPGYSTFQYALEYSKTLPPLKEEGVNYSFYVMSDEHFEMDSSLLVEVTSGRQNNYRFQAWSQTSKNLVNISRNNLTKMILNQVGTKLPSGSANKEFIENLAGNFIVVNNEDNTVSGGLPNTWGSEGDSVVDIYPVRLEEDTDNGVTYSVTGWFNTPISNAFANITSYPHFYNLIVDAGMFDDLFSRFTFLTDGEFYTIFIPSAEALSNYNTDTLSQQELEQFIKYHFIRGERIWTDGSSSDGYYETLREDELSTEFIKKYSTLNIKSSADLIEILDKDGNVYIDIPEDGNHTNIMIATDLDDVSTSPYDYIVTGVIHEIDSVLIKQ